MNELINNLKKVTKHLQPVLIVLGVIVAIYTIRDLRERYSMYKDKKICHI